MEGDASIRVIVLGTDTGFKHLSKSTVWRWYIHYYPNLFLSALHDSRHCPWPAVASCLLSSDQEKHSYLRKLSTSVSSIRIVTVAFSMWSLATKTHTSFGITLMHQKNTQMS